MLRDFIEQLPIGKPSPESTLVHNVLLVMKEFGYTAEEMKNMHLPTFSNILDFLRKESEREKKMMERSQRKR